MFMVKNRITQIFFIVFSLIIFCDKLWADEVPYAQAIPSVEDEITGSWFGKCIDYSSGQAYEIELLVSKNFNDQFECTMQISDYKSVYKHCFAISTDDYTYYLKDLDSKYLSGIQNFNPVLQKVWLHAMLTPIVFNKILVGEALINTSKLLNITLKKENSDKNFTIISAIGSITRSNVKNNLVEKPVLDSEIPSSLKASAIFNTKKLTKTDSYRLWYRIPNWVAGTWAAGTWIDVIYSKTLGCQVDKLGNIWDTTLLPTYSSGPVSNNKIFTSTDITIAFNPEDYNNQNSWTCQTEHQQIDFVNNNIYLVTQYTSTNIYTLIKPGKMRFLTLTHWRNEFGGWPNRWIGHNLFHEKPIIQPSIPLKYVLKLKQPFKPRNFGKDGTDLKADFINYLRSHNLNDLVPN